MRDWLEAKLKDALARRDSQTENPCLRAWYDGAASGYRNVLERLRTEDEGPGMPMVTVTDRDDW